MDSELSYQTSSDDYPEETKDFYSAYDNTPSPDYDGITTSQHSRRSRTKYYVAGVLVGILGLSVAAIMLLEQQGEQKRYERDTTSAVTERYPVFLTTQARREATASEDQTFTEATRTEETSVTFFKSRRSPTTPASRTLRTRPRSSSTEATSAAPEENTWNMQDELSSSVPDTSQAQTPIASEHPKEESVSPPGPKPTNPLIVCVLGAFLRLSEPLPAGICSFTVFAHVRVARDSEEFVGVDNQISFDNYMQMATSETNENFLLSLSSASEFDESLEVQERAAAILSQYRRRNIRGYGFARYRVASAGVEVGKLWKHHKMLFNLRYWSKDPITLFLGLQVDHHRSYSEEYITGLVAEASASMDFVIIVTHFTAPPNVASKSCQVELIGSWQPEAFNDRRLISTKEGASVVNSTLLDRGVKLPLLLSQSLAVVEYTVKGGLKVEEARLRDLKCSKAALVPFATVCNSTSTFIRGKHRTPTFSHYDDDPKNGRWRTYKTSLDMLKDIQSVAHALDPSVSNMTGWAFYDIDLEDYRGDCAAYWGPRKKFGGQKAAAYYRLKMAAALAKADLRDKDSSPDSTGFTNDPQYALIL